MKSVAFLFLFLWVYAKAFSQGNTITLPLQNTSTNLRSDSVQKNSGEIIIPYTTRDPEQDSVRKFVPYNTLITTQSYQGLIEEEKKKKNQITTANEPK
jgi:hypothetical protein